MTSGWSGWTYSTSAAQPRSSLVVCHGPAGSVDDARSSVAFATSMPTLQRSALGLLSSDPPTVRAQPCECELESIYRTSSDRRSADAVPQLLNGFGNQGGHGLPRPGSNEIEDTRGSGGNAPLTRANERSEVSLANVAMRA